ncbi:hypothetical protein QFC19_003391 [Naganishia cerealis]|uniref:Uncharacterized protein n=1 Tax=Naganishia cerealis TaxID=610337 RepID=A0ACC2W2Z4_9TREE|nr:hypothetical protein QFC19_003391 [Naganishia cerealis]
MRSTAEDQTETKGKGESDRDKVSQRIGTSIPPGVSKESQCPLLQSRGDDKQAEASEPEHFLVKRDTRRFIRFPVNNPSRTLDYLEVPCSANAAARWTWDIKPSLPPCQRWVRA